MPKPGTSVQKAKLGNMTQPFRQQKGNFTTIYTDSSYAFASVHIHGIVFRKRGLLIIGKMNITKKIEKILVLLEAIWLSLQTAILHC